MADESFAPIFDSLGTTSSRPIRTPKTSELVALKLRRMIVDGQLADGDRLPHEVELMEHFSVSRPTLREAVRVLEAERLVEVRRGSRSGARVCVPGPEVVARPAALLLELSGATVADVLVAREAIEPLAARILALIGTDADFDELERMVDVDIPASYTADRLYAGSAAFHLRLVQLCHNATLALLAGMMHEIFERHVEAVTADRSRRDHERYEGNYLLLIRSCRRLIKLLRARDADAAYDHWHQHMSVSRSSLLVGHESTQVRDVLD